MARSGVKEFVSRMRINFFGQLDDGVIDEATPEIKHAFERAVNDTLLGNGAEPKPTVKKARKKRSARIRPDELMDKIGPDQRDSR